MARFARLIWGAVAAASLLMAGAAAVAWPRSGTFASTLWYDAAGSHAAVESADGVLNLTVATSPRRDGGPGGRWTNVAARGFSVREFDWRASGVSLAGGAGRSVLQRLGFSVDWFTAAGANSMLVPGSVAVVASAPHWAAILVSLLAPAAWVWGWRRRAARAAGGCRVCGYDLRGTPERCPECGTDTAARPAA